MQYPIVDYFIEVNIDGRNGGTNTELFHKFIFQAPVFEICMDIPKNILVVFPFRLIENDFFCINDSALMSIFPPQLRKLAHSLQIMCGCEICIQCGTYQ